MDQDFADEGGVFHGADTWATESRRMALEAEESNRRTDRWVNAMAIFCVIAIAVWAIWS